MRAKLLMVFFMLASTAVLAGDKTAGEWKKAGPPAQVNIKCSQVWKCTYPDVLHDPDEKVVATDNKLVWGTCTAAAGPIDSCNECLVEKPKERCEYWLEKKKK